MDITIDTKTCHVCNTEYPKFTVGKKHVYATCVKCMRRDEVGIVY